MTRQELEFFRGIIIYRAYTVESSSREMNETSLIAISNALDTLISIDEKLDELKLEELKLTYVSSV